MEITAKIKGFTEPVTGQTKKGDPWSKIDVIFDIEDGNYTNPLCIGFWNDTGKAVQSNHKEGDILSMDIKMSSREYNGKWYTEIKCWKFVPVVGKASPPAPAQSFAPRQQLPAATPPELDDDVLPF